MIANHQLKTDLLVSKMDPRVFVTLVIYFTSSSNGQFRQVPEMLNFDVVFYDMGPFVYKSHHDDGNITHEGIFSEIFKNAMTYCRLNLTWSVDLGNNVNFAKTIKDPKLREPYTSKKMVWLSLIERIPPETLMQAGLVDIDLFKTPGFEVVVHRNTIGLLPKLANGIYGCRYFIILTFIMVIGVGILIWIAVSSV